MILECMVALDVGGCLIDACMCDKAVLVVGFSSLICFRSQRVYPVECGARVHFPAVVIVVENRKRFALIPGLLHV